jgi:hypothetical protein
MRPLAAVFCVFAVQACAHEHVLEPAAGAPLAPGRRNVAETTASGVTVLVTGDSWKGDPQDLENLFTPVRVTIENHSGKTLRVSYRDFGLAGASGLHYAVVPRIEARGGLSAHEATSPPSLRLADWEPGSHVALQFPYLPPGVDSLGRFAYEPPQSGRSPASWPEGLPTRDMISEALPEGPVRDGGRVAGFVYFQRVTGRESEVEFELSLVDASEGQAFALVAIPFRSIQPGWSEDAEMGTGP